MEKAILTPDQLKYLAHLVDEDTTGQQDDELYIKLMQVWNDLRDGQKVIVFGFSPLKNTLLNRLSSPKLDIVVQGK